MSTELNEMISKAIPPLSRFEGRLFLMDGRLHYVLDVDAETETARVSCRVDGQQQVIELPTSEIALRLSTSTNIALDGLASPQKATRITERTDGWFFSTRDGLKGPFGSDTEASAALDNYLLSVQSA